MVKWRVVIYTKRGDKGKTSLYDSKNAQNIRISKASLRIRAIGAVDEANSYLGVILSGNKSLGPKIHVVQENLFKIGAILAGAKLKLDAAETKSLEKEIDRLEGKLPVLKNFVLPGGSRSGAGLHYTRALVRRAEREIVALSKKAKVDQQVLIYINRLSDYLFIQGRYENHKFKSAERIWRSTRK